MNGPESLASSPTFSRSRAMQDHLSSLNAQGNFIASVLTNADGLPIAAATTSGNRLADLLAAVAPLVERMVQRSNERAGLAAADEVAIRNADDARLVCRFFEAGGDTLILACVAPASQPHRRVMNQAVRAIAAIWGAGS